MPADDLRSRPLWWDDVALASGGETLGGDVDTDIAVIGAGYTGLSAAYHCAQAGLDTIVLEASTIGFGASGRNGGIIGGVHAGNLKAEMQRFGRDEFHRQRLLDLDTVQIVENLVRRNEIDCDFERAGEMCLAHAPRHVPM